MADDLSKLRIDRTKKRSEGSGWAGKWIITGIVLFLLLGTGRWVFGRLNAAVEVELQRVTATTPGAGQTASGDVILNATGYIIAAHKIQVASKVIGRVAWIGVEKGDRVKEGQVIV